MRTQRCAGLTRLRPRWHITAYRLRRTVAKHDGPARVGGQPLPTRRRSPSANRSRHRPTPVIATRPAVSTGSFTYQAGRQAHRPLTADRCHRPAHVPERNEGRGGPDRPSAGGAGGCVRGGGDHGRAGGVGPGGMVGGLATLGLASAGAATAAAAVTRGSGSAEPTSSHRSRR